MIAALALALTQAAPIHASLHPPGVVVYAEVPDVAATLANLEGSPLARLLRDERMKGLIEKIGLPVASTLADAALGGLVSAIPNAKAQDWFGQVRTFSLSAGSPLKEGDLQPPLQVVLDFVGEGPAGVFVSGLLASADKHEPASGPWPGLENLTLGGGAPGLWCGRVGARCFLGTLDLPPTEVAARAAGSTSGFDADELQKNREGWMPEAPGAPVMWLAFHMPDSEKLKSFTPIGIPMPFGDHWLERLTFHDGRFVTDILSTETTEGTRPVDPTWLDPVLAGSMLVYTRAIDGPTAAKLLRELLAKSESASAAMKALEEKLGYGLERPLARLGPGMSAFMAPLAGMGLPDTRMWIDCDDPAAFASEIEALVNAFGATQPGYEAKTKPYKVKLKDSEDKKEVPITTITLPNDLIQVPMISISPSFAPVGKKLVFAFSSMDLKNELKRAYSGEASAPGAKPLSAFGFEPPSEALSVVVMDWGKLLDSVSSTVKLIAGMAGGSSGIDPKLFPPAGIFSEFFKPTFHYSKKTPKGLVRRNEGSFGPETWFGLVGGAWLGKQRFKGATGAASGFSIPPAGGK